MPTLNNLYCFFVTLATFWLRKSSIISPGADTKEETEETFQQREDKTRKTNR